MIISAYYNESGWLFFGSLGGHKHFVVSLCCGIQECFLFWESNSISVVIKVKI